MPDKLINALFKYEIFVRVLNLPGSVQKRERAANFLREQPSGPRPRGEVVPQRPASPHPDFLLSVPTTLLRAGQLKILKLRATSLRTDQQRHVPVHLLPGRRPFDLQRLERQRPDLAVLPAAGVGPAHRA